MFSDYLSLLSVPNPTLLRNVDLGQARQQLQGGQARVQVRLKNILSSLKLLSRHDIHLPARDEAVTDQVGGADKQGVRRV